MTPSQPEASQKAPGRARFIIGISVFSVGMMCPLWVPLVAASDLPTPWKATLSATLLLGAPEVLMLVAVAILGKPGYREMKRRLSGVLRRLRPAERVGRLRHRLGVAMFVLPALAGWLYPYLALWIEELASYELRLALGLDAVFFGSLFVLGGEFWDKLSALFMRTATH